MEGVSITASVLSITTAAVQSVQFLVKTIDNIKDAPETIGAVSTDLRILQPVLHDLGKAAQDDASQIVLSEPVKHAVENCARACQTFRLQIESWTKHSTQDKMFWVDRWKIGLFGLERIKTFRGQLGDCKGTLSMALATVGVFTATRQEYLMQEMKEMMLLTHEATTRQQIVRTTDETREIQLNIQQVLDNEVVAALPQVEEAHQSRSELLHELRQQQAANQNFAKMCEEALSQTRAQHKIKGVKATSYGSALTGFINTTGEESKIDLDVSDVSADNYGVAVAGVVKNFDFKDLRPS
ncbi:hypothetical protein C7974DRAFT_394979, partial [Boeremia exigua]|uniref:uncharacterized protein n=1 Tax=Boeremia exigua TaxID=749465 RepID=UPI001E8E608E